MSGVVSGRKEQGTAEREGDAVYLGSSGRRGLRTAGRELLGAWGAEQEGWGGEGSGLSARSLAGHQHSCG